MLGHPNLKVTRPIIQHFLKLQLANQPIGCFSVNERSKEAKGRIEFCLYSRVRKDERGRGEARENGWKSRLRE